MKIQWKYPLLFWLFGATFLLMVIQAINPSQSVDWNSWGTYFMALIYSIPFALMGLVIGWKKK